MNQHALDAENAQNLCTQRPVIVIGKALIDHDRCADCGRCIAVCSRDAVTPAFDEANGILNCKMAEYAKAVIQHKPHFAINFVIDVSPNCDCHGENDIPIVPDVGMFASFAPVAIDMACADAVNKQNVIPSSQLDKSPSKTGDQFNDSAPTTNKISQITHGQKIGLGNKDYKLITIE